MFESRTFLFYVYVCSFVLYCFLQMISFHTLIAPFFQLAEVTVRLQNNRNNTIAKSGSKSTEQKYICIYKIVNRSFHPEHHFIYTSDDDFCIALFFNNQFVV